MSAPYFHLLGHIFVAVEAYEQRASLASVMDNAGFGADQIDEGRALLARGEELIDRKADEVGDDRIYEHNLHKAADEVEMWKSTAAFRLKKALDDESLVDDVLGRELHADNHTVTVVGQSLRLIAMVRTHADIHEQLGSPRQVKDLLVRGWVLLEKLFKNGDILMSPGSAGDPDAPVLGDIMAHRVAMFDWLAQLGQAAASLADDPGQLGYIGYVPEGVGLPLGGTAYSVPLHEKAQREDLPDMDDLRPDPGWSAGRQGRNRENLGSGWVEPTFDS